MTRFFLDSSALLKRYLNEVGAVWVRTITAPSANNTILIAHVASVEVVSGISRRKREGFIPSRTAQAIRLLLNRHIQREYVVIQLSDAVILRAQNLLENHALRAYDSIQLASALIANTRLLAVSSTPLHFVSADSRLCSIAAEEGLATSNPTDKEG